MTTVIALAAVTLIAAVPAVIQSIGSAALSDTAVAVTLFMAGALLLIAAVRDTEIVLIITDITAMVIMAVADTSAFLAFTWTLVDITGIDSKLIY